MNKSKRRNKIKLLNNMNKLILRELCFAKERNSNFFNNSIKKAFARIDLIRNSKIDKNTGQVKYFYRISFDQRTSFFDSIKQALRINIRMMQEVPTKLRIRKIKTIGKYIGIVFRDKDLINEQIKTKK